MSVKAGMETEIWQQYEQGVDYKTRIGLYRTVDLNERFYSGDQWVGVPHEGLPTPVVNFIKYATAWKVAAVTERRLGMQFYADGLSDGGDIGIYARQVSDYCDMLWERLKMDYVTKEGLKQAAITGDYVQYFYWDSELSTGQAVTGDIATQLIDSVNYYPGNPNTPDVQSQPYIILAFREMVDKVREEARRNGCENVDEITADEETEYTAGDRGKVEMDGSGKCNVLLKMYKQDGRVWCEKAVRNAIVQPAKDTKLARYPVALMNWETRKNCCHGVAEVTGLIPNQVYINKIMALSQLSQMQMSFPKVVYDRTRIREWTNKVAGAIPVNGDIGGAAQYLTPPGISYDAWRGLDVTLDKTMRMMGANDVTLGSIRNPDNTSAFIAARDAAMVPLQSHQERFYAFVEDIGQIWLDFIRSFYKGGRMIPVVKDGQRIFVPLPDGALDEYAMRLKVEVGPSTMWSEIQVLQTLDNLLKGGKLTLKQYLERLPDGHIPMKQELLEEVAEMEAEKKGAGGQAPAGATAFARPGIGMPMAAGSAVQMEQAKSGQGGQGVPGMPAGMPPGAGGGMPPTGGGGGMPSMQGAAGQQPSIQGASGNAGAAGAGSGITGGLGSPPLLVTILKLVQAGAQSGDVKPEVAQAVGKAMQSGADITEIVEVLKKAAAQGMVSEKFMTALAETIRSGMGASAAGGPGVPPLQSAGGNTGGAAGGQQPPMQGAVGNAGVAAGAGAGMALTLRGGTQGGLSVGQSGVDAASANPAQARPSSGAARHLPPREGFTGAEVGAGMAGGLGSPPLLVTILKLVQAGAQSGDVKPEVAQAVGKAMQSGADITEIVEVLKKAAAQGMVSEKFMQMLKQSMQSGAGGTGAPPPQSMGAGVAAGAGAGMAGGPGVPPLQGTNGTGVAAGAGTGMAGGQLPMPLKAASGQAVQVGRQPSSGPAGHLPPGEGFTGAAVGVGAAVNTAGASKRAGVNIKRKADMAMGITGLPDTATVPQDGKAMMEALMALLKEGVASGDVDADVPEAVGKMIGSGINITAEQIGGSTLKKTNGTQTATAFTRPGNGVTWAELSAAIIAALKQASEAGKISPLVLAKTEKLLGSGGTGAEEATDRNQLLRSNKNKLTR